MKLTKEPYILINALQWRRNSRLMVVTQRHGQLLLEDFDDANATQQWYLGINGEIYTSIRDHPRYIRYTDGCVDLDITPEKTGGWAFDTLGEHPHKYRIVPRTCPSHGLRATLGSVLIGLEPNAYTDDSNAWYIIPLRDMTEKRTSHVRPIQ